MSLVELSTFAVLILVLISLAIGAFFASRTSALVSNSSGDLAARLGRIENAFTGLDRGMRDEFSRGREEIRRGGDCYAIWISKKTLRRLGPLTPEGVPTDRLKDLTILQGDDDTLVTTFRSERGKAYRREARRTTR
jgi:hypothetical protein